MGRIKKIGLLTSGGDAPGMNAAIRGVVRAATNNGIDVIGFLHGYKGLIENETTVLEKFSVSNIVNRGGTILYTARSKEFLTPEGRKKAFDNIKKNELDALVALGGDGTFAGAYELSKLGVNVIGIPATIDLDIACTEYSIGFDTAINTAMEGIDKIRDTSTSHERCSIIEVMGRRAGLIAAYTGIATGAEEVILPEHAKEDELSSIITRVMIAHKKGKKHYIIVNAEGFGNSETMAKEIEKATGVETRATILGHLQRGGIPTCKDRVYASMLAVKAIDTLIEGKENRLVVYRNGEFTDIDIKEGLDMKRKNLLEYLHVNESLQSK